MKGHKHGYTFFLSKQGSLASSREASQNRHCSARSGGSAADGIADSVGHVWHPASGGNYRLTKCYEKMVAMQPLFLLVLIKKKGGVLL